MRRRDFLLTALVTPLFPTSVKAQALGKVWRVGALSPSPNAIETIRTVTLPELGARLSNAMLRGMVQVSKEKQCALALHRPIACASLRRLWTVQIIAHSALT
jgi:hypothetical protein